MEAGKPSIQESDAHAREQKSFTRTGKRAAQLATFAENEDNNDNLDDEERAAVDAICLQRGRPPYNRPGQSSGQNQQARPANPRQGQQQQPFSGQCRFCKIQGHHQKDCRKRKAAKAPMVNGNGKPYTNQLAAVAPPQQQYNNASAASITSVPSDPYHLKW